MQKNVDGQIWVVMAYQDEGGANPGEPVEGDAANITGVLYQDGDPYSGAGTGTQVLSLSDTNPTELGGGLYAFTLTQSESNANHLALEAVSSTANVNVLAMPQALYTTPSNFPLLSINGTGGVDVATIVQAAQSGINLFKVLQLLARSDSAIATDNATELAALNADGGSGEGNYVGTSDSLEALADNQPTVSQFVHYDGTMTRDSDTTMTLGASASSVTDFYKGMTFSCQGKAQGIIRSYDGTSKQATTTTLPVALVTGSTIQIATDMGLKGQDILTRPTATPSFDNSSTVEEIFAWWFGVSKNEVINNGDKIFFMDDTGTGTMTTYDFTDDGTTLTIGAGF